MQLNRLFNPCSMGTDLVLADTVPYNNVMCDFYDRPGDDIYMTRQQVGQALGYSNPQKAIDNIHQRHKERLDKFSVTLNLRGSDGKTYVTTAYSAKGVYEICRWSRQPKADMFMDFVWEVVERLRKQQMTPPLTNAEIIDQAATKITAKLFPQFVKTVSATLSKDIVERIRSLPQGEQLLQPPEPIQQPKPKRQTITLYIVIAWDDENGTQVYKTKDYDKFIALVKDITLQGKQYTVERIKTTSYK